MSHDDGLPVVKFDNTDPLADKNLRSVRPRHQSPIDNTKAGVVNLGTDTTGVTTGASANYATIGGGDQNVASGIGATVPGGTGNSAIGNNSLAEGAGTTANGIASHTEGSGTMANAASAHAEGNSTAPGVTGVASGLSAHVEGTDCVASGPQAHAEGLTTVASGNHSHAEGESTTASGSFSHAEGSSGNAGVTGLASGNSSHVEGANCIASGSFSHAQGVGSQASRLGQHADSSFAPSTAGAYQHALVTYGAAAIPADTPTELLDSAASALALEDSKTYGLKVRMVASNVEGLGIGSQIIHDLLVHTDAAGVATIDDDNLTLNQNAPGHLFVVSVTSTPPVLHLTLTNNNFSDTINAAATIDWTETPNTVHVP